MFICTVDKLCAGAGTSEEALAGTRASELPSLAEGGAGGAGGACGTSGGLDSGSVGASSRSAKIRN